MISSYGESQGMFIDDWQHAQFLLKGRPPFKTDWQNNDNREIKSLAQNRWTIYQVSQYDDDQAYLCATLTLFIQPRSSFNNIYYRADIAWCLRIDSIAVSLFVFVYCLIKQQRPNNFRDEGPCQPADSHEY